MIEAAPRRKDETQPRAIAKRTHLSDALLHRERVGRLELELLEAAHEALQQVVRQARLLRAHRAAAHAPRPAHRS